MAGMDNKLYKLDTLLGSAVEVACPEPAATEQSVQRRQSRSTRLSLGWHAGIGTAHSPWDRSITSRGTSLGRRLITATCVRTARRFSPDGRILYHTDSMRRDHSQVRS